MLGLAGFASPAQAQTGSGPDDATNFAARPATNAGGNSVADSPTNAADSPANSATAPATNSASGSSTNLTADSTNAAASSSTHAAADTSTNAAAAPPETGGPEPSFSLNSGNVPSESSKLGQPETANPSASLRFLFPSGDPDALPGHLLVVYNSNDPQSKALAAYYAMRRSIAADHVLGIPCAGVEEISRAEYGSTIREPIISYIYKHGWMIRRNVTVHLDGRPVELLAATENDIWAMVLIRGVPLKIAPDPTNLSHLQHQPALQTNAAAVDSELALLPIFGLPIGGFIPNSFCDDTTHDDWARAGPELATRLILVTRLDGPTPGDVRRMIDDTLFAEENRLAGLAVIDSRGLNDVKDPYALGDVWLRQSRDLLARNGWSVTFDAAPDVLPPSDPCDQVAFYLGWYHDGAFGPWVTPPDRFVRGAIAYHLHSYSAGTVRSATQGWVGPLIAHGAAATMGAVYEPYLALTPHLEIFTRRLLAGNYFAEAAYASQPALSWMITVVGDPLYRPFHKSLEAALADSTSATPSDHHDWLLLQKIQREIASGQLAPTLDNLEHYLDVPGAVTQEGLGDLLTKLHDPDALLAAEGAYRNAAGLEEQPIDHIRVGLKLAQSYMNNAQADQAQAELKTLREMYPVEASRFGVADPLVPTAAPENVPVAPISTPVNGPPPRPPAPPRPPRPM